MADESLEQKVYRDNSKLIVRTTDMVTMRDYVAVMFAAHEKEHELIRRALEISEKTLEKTEANLTKQTEYLFAAHQNQHRMIEVALDKAENAVNSRLQGMNELREQINIERGALATKDMLHVRIYPLETFQNKILGFALGLTILNGLVTTLIIFALRK